MATATIVTPAAMARSKAASSSVQSKARPTGETQLGSRLSSQETAALEGLKATLSTPDKPKASKRKPAKKAPSQAPKAHEASTKPADQLNTAVDTSVTESTSQVHEFRHSMSVLALEHPALKALKNPVAQNFATAMIQAFAGSPTDCESKDPQLQPRVFAYKQARAQLSKAERQHHKAITHSYHTVLHVLDDTYQLVHATYAQAVK